MELTARATSYAGQKSVETRYMIEKLGIPPGMAVERFKMARGHGIERQNYIDDLHNGCKGGSESNSNPRSLQGSIMANKRKYTEERRNLIQEPDFKRRAELDQQNNTDSVKSNVPYPFRQGLSTGPIDNHRKIGEFALRRDRPDIYQYDNSRSDYMRNDMPHKRPDFWEDQIWEDESAFKNDYASPNPWSRSDQTSNNQGIRNNENGRSPTSFTFAERYKPSERIDHSTRNNRETNYDQRADVNSFGRSVRNEKPFLEDRTASLKYESRQPRTTSFVDRRPDVSRYAREERPVSSMVKEYVPLSKRNLSAPNRSYSAHLESVRIKSDDQKPWSTSIQKNNWGNSTLSANSPPLKMPEDVLKLTRNQDHGLVPPPKKSLFDFGSRKPLPLPENKHNQLNLHSQQGPLISTTGKPSSNPLIELSKRLKDTEKEQYEQRTTLLPTSDTKKEQHQQRTPLLSTPGTEKEQHRGLVPPPKKSLFDFGSRKPLPLPENKHNQLNLHSQQGPLSSTTGKPSSNPLLELPMRLKDTEKEQYEQRASLLPTPDTKKEQHQQRTSLLSTPGTEKEQHQQRTPLLPTPHKESAGLNHTKAALLPTPNNHLHDGKVSIQPKTALLPTPLPIHSNELRELTMHHRKGLLPTPSISPHLPIATFMEFPRPSHQGGQKALLPTPDVSFDSISHQNKKKGLLPTPILPILQELPSVFPRTSSPTVNQRLLTYPDKKKGLLPTPNAFDMF